MANGAEANVATRSASAEAMEPYFKLIADVLGGKGAIERASTRYLPKYEEETNGEYNRRLASAPWRPEFADIVRSLSGKPFAKPLAVIGELSQRLQSIVDDADGCGANLHRFCAYWFADAVAHGMSAVLVDYPSDELERNTLEYERRRRPYLVHIPGKDIIAAYGEMRDGRQYWSHIRIAEQVLIQEGFGERLVKRVRVIEPTKWELWEDKSENNSSRWEMIDSGRYKFSSTEDIPFVVFFTGARTGAMSCRPPLLDCAYMQLDLYRALSRQEEILTYAASPMLTAKGLTPPDDGKIEVGPKRVLYAPGVENITTGWDYIQPAAANIKEIRENIESLSDALRRLGMQPLTQKAGSVTATATSVETAKAHSTLEGWCADFEDACNLVLYCASQWLGESYDARVEIYSDFAATEERTEDSKMLLEARKEAQISQPTFWREMQRRGVLGPQFDPAKEAALLDSERKQQLADYDIAAAMGG